MKRRGSRVDGVLLLDKPSGVSSNAALQRARRAFGAAKAGHTGTLDPLASGLLPICLGEATKFAQYLLDAAKRYRAIVRFGVETDTLDAEGRVVATHPVAIDAAKIRAALPALTGAQLQCPPAYSALKHQGRPHYEYARAGVAVPRIPRAVEVMRLDLVAWSPPDAVLDVECSKGTYVRVLASDLGARLGCGAHLAGLRRTATGGFDIEAATPLELLEAMTDAERAARLLPVDVLVSHLPRLVVHREAAAAFGHGRPVPAPVAAAGLHAVFGGGRLLGVADVAGQVAQPRRLVAPSPDMEAA